MDNHFDPYWARIASPIHSGLTIRNWGAARGYTGGTFNVVDVDGSGITVSGADMRAPRRISKGEFQKIYPIWEDYVSRNYPRSKMTNLSQNTTYILSILRSIVFDGTFLMASIVFDGRNGSGEAAYQEWLHDHPTGFVLTTRRRHDPTYLVLHKVTCHSISRPTHQMRENPFTGRSYISRSALRTRTLCSYGSGSKVDRGSLNAALFAGREPKLFSIWNRQRGSSYGIPKVVSRAAAEAMVARWNF